MCFNMKILYWLENFPDPCGGVHKIYDDVMLLNELGYESYVLHDTPFRVSWFKHNVPVISLKYMDVSSEDIVVIPEYKSLVIEKFRKCKYKIFYVQSWYYVNEIPDDYDFIITAGDYDAQWLYENRGIEVDGIIHNGIDFNLFYPSPENRVLNRVLYLHRKNGSDGDYIRLNLQGKMGLDFQCIDEISQEELAEEYRMADIFIALGTNEGFQMPPIEAMACGCIVVGYSGHGALQYMRHKENCFIVEDLDKDGLIKAIITIVNDKSLKEKMRRNGYKTSKRYSLERQKDDLKNFYEKIIGAPEGISSIEPFIKKAGEKVVFENYLLNQGDFIYYQASTIRNLNKNLAKAQKELEKQVSEFHNSLGIQVLLKFRRIIGVFLPEGTRRRSIYNRLINFIKK